MRQRNIIKAAALGLSLLIMAAGSVFAGDGSGRHSVWRGNCGPYGHRGPSGGCIPGGPYGAGSYYFLGPEYYNSRTFIGPPTYGEAPAGAGTPDYGVGYWGTRSYDIPAFQ